MIREDSWLGYWLGLPWRCKVRHSKVVVRYDEGADLYPDYHYAYECGRCENWMGWADTAEGERQ